MYLSGGNTYHRAVLLAPAGKVWLEKTEYSDNRELGNLFRGMVRLNHKPKQREAY